METTFPDSYAGELRDMGKAPVKQPLGVFGRLKQLGEFGALIGILVLLWAINSNIAGYKYEYIELNKSVNKVLQIYERREDAGRAALQAEIDRLELELNNPKPAERRKAMQDKLISLKKRLETSQLNSKDVAGGLAGSNSVQEKQ